MQSPLIAVVDDDPEIRQMLEMLLHSAGYRTLLWDHGKDAHLIIRRNKPDLVILDMWMEDRDAGRTVLGLMELDPGTQRIPVIICSAHVEALRARIHQFSERGYTILPKPFEPEELLQQVRARLAGRS